MAIFTKRESGWIQARVRRIGWPSQSRSFATKTEAQVWARQVEAGMDLGVFTPTHEAERTLFSALAERFSREFAPQHYRGEGWAHKLAHLVRRLGQYSLIAITSDVVAGYRDARLTDPDSRYKDHRKAPRVSSSTVKTEINLLSRILDVAQKELKFYVSERRNHQKGA